MNYEICPFCGLRTEKNDGPTHKYLVSSPGCWNVYGEVLAREYQDYRFFKYHDVTVDAYALQHPGEKSKQTINSANIHLASLYAFFSLGHDASALSRIKQLIAGKKLGDKLGKKHVKKHVKKLGNMPPLKWLDPPEDLTGITVASLLSVNNPGEYHAKLIEWAYFVFRKWEAHHDTADYLIRSLQ